jgi:endonuclease YncB( thermonuclease family)
VIIREVGMDRFTQGSFFSRSEFIVDESLGYRRHRISKICRREYGGFWNDRDKMKCEVERLDREPKGGGQWVRPGDSSRNSSDRAVVEFDWKPSQYGVYRLHNVRITRSRKLTTGVLHCPTLHPWPEHIQNRSENLSDAHQVGLVSIDAPKTSWGRKIRSVSVCSMAWQNRSREGQEAMKSTMKTSVVVTLDKIVTKGMRNL